MIPAFKGLYENSVARDILRKKRILKKLDKDSKSLEYISVQRGGEENTLFFAHFDFYEAGDNAITCFERCTGVSLEDNLSRLEILEAYDAALVKEIDRERWLKHQCKDRIR